MFKKILPWHAICKLASKSMIMTKQKKKAETKNQHYVPQFYLRYFSVDMKNVGVYILKSGKNIPSVPIKGQASRDYFYSDSMEIEKTLGALEVRAKGVIDRIIAAPTEPLGEEDKDTLFLFTVIQRGRTAEQADLFREVYDRILPFLLNEYSKISTSAGRLEQGECIKDKASGLIGEPPPFPARESVYAHAQISHIMRDLSVKILINKTSKAFITSDNPVAKYDQFIERMRQETYGLGTRGLQIFFPLSPRIGVMYYDPKCYKLGYKKREYVELDQEKDIDELNKLTSCNSGGLLYYDPRTVSIQELDALGKMSSKFAPKSIESKVEGLSSNESRCTARHPSLFCKLSLSFIKELPRFKALRPKDFDSSKHMFRDLEVNSRASY